MVYVFVGYKEGLRGGQGSEAEIELNHVVHVRTCVCDRARLECPRVCVCACSSVCVNLTAQLNNEWLINDYSAQRASCVPWLTTGARPRQHMTYTHTYKHTVSPMFYPYYLFLPLLTPARVT